MMQSLVYIESAEEGLDSLTKQMACGIRKIPAELRGPVKGISLGKHLQGKEEQLKGIFDELIRVDVPSELEFNTEAIANILTDLLGEQGPAILFVGYTHRGMELGPAVGWRLNVPVVTNCSGFDWSGGTTAQVRRPILGGKLIATLDVRLESGAVVSVQKGAWNEEGSLDPTLPSPVVTDLPWKETWKPEKTEVLGILEESLEGEEDITKAEILVSVGRGLGDPENLPIMRELAEKLGAMISCSRPVVDLGWLPGIRQVGISGRTVSPVIYIALGISGQSNHLAGMDASRIIIGVNKDPAAPIFSVAHYGVIDDILEFVPELLEQLKQKKAP
jgi:electron transfer flavoprotein alpha subunit